MCLLLTLKFGVASQVTKAYYKSLYVFKIGQTNERLYGFEKEEQVSFFPLKSFTNALNLYLVSLFCLSKAPCCVLCCLPASQVVLKRFRRVNGTPPTSATRRKRFKTVKTT